MNIDQEQRLILLIALLLIASVSLHVGFMFMWSRVPLSDHWAYIPIESGDHIPLIFGDETHQPPHDARDDHSLTAPTTLADDQEKPREEKKTDAKKIDTKKVDNDDDWGSIAPQTSTPPAHKKPARTPAQSPDAHSADDAPPDTAHPEDAAQPEAQTSGDHDEEPDLPADHQEKFSETLSADEHQHRTDILPENSLRELLEVAPVYTSPTLPVAKHPQKRKTVPPAPRTATPESLFKKEETQAKPTFSLADLARGFVKPPQADGVKNYTGITMDGTPGGAVSTQQLVIGRYNEKVLYCLHKAFTIRKDQLLKLVTSPDRRVTSPDVVLCLNRDGRLIEVYITASSGNADIDAFVLDVFHEANGTFPPLPESLNMNQHYLSFSNTIGILMYPQGTRVRRGL